MANQTTYIVRSDGNIDLGFAGDVYIADSGNNQILEYPLGGGQEIVAARAAWKRQLRTAEMTRA